MYLCERCHQNEALKNIKYCKSCKKEVIAEMEHDGYLQKITSGHKGNRRTREMKENEYETKHGPWQR